MATKTGRPKRGLIDVMKSKTWLDNAKLVSGTKSAYALGIAVHGGGVGNDKHFEKYQAGTLSPGEMTMNLVEGEWSGTKNVYLIGPKVGNQYVRLWDALAGSIEDAWSILEEFDVAFKRSRLFGFNQSHRIAHLMTHMLARNDTLALDVGPILTDLHHMGIGAFAAPEDGFSDAQKILVDTAIWIFRSPILKRESGIDVELKNPITRRWTEGNLKFDLPILTATIALWRIAHFLGEGWHEMDSLLRGLSLAPGRHHKRDDDGNVVYGRLALNLPSAIVSVLGPYRIEKEFFEMIDAMWQKSTNEYAVVVHSMAPGNTRLIDKYAVTDTP